MSNEKEPVDARIPRRRFVGGMATGLIAASAAPVFAQQGGLSSQQTPSQSVKQNPVTQYQKPPFPQQQQEPSGPVWTPLQVSGGQPPSALEKFGGDTPLKRPGQPAELAPIYVLLASQESSYATGQVYGDSGGKGNP